MRHDVVDVVVARAIPERSYPEQWRMDELEAELKTMFNLELSTKHWPEEEGIDPEIVRDRLVEATDKAFADKEARFIKAMADNGRPNEGVMREIEKSILLTSIDNLWREHLVTLDHLSKVVGWRGLAQRDPLNEYKQEAYELFQKLLTDLRETVITQLSHIEIQFQQQPAPALDLSRLSEIHIDPDLGENDAASQVSGTIGGAFAAAGALAGLGGDVAEADPRLRPIDPKLLVGVSRNAPCPCGSGKKFKHCHGSF
jgi:preprotein translocase subunit SecA